MSESCQIRRDLSEEFARAARLYSEAVINLAIPRNLTPEEHQRLSREVANAEGRSQRARLAYDAHIQRHRCTGTVPKLLKASA